MEVAVMHVVELLATHCAHSSGRGHRCGPVVDLAWTDHVGARGIALEHAPCHVQRAAQRRDRVHRITMCLDHARIGKHLEQTIHLRDVTWILQQPALPGCIDTDEPQHVDEAPVRRRLLLRAKPALV